MTSSLNEINAKLADIARNYKFDPLEFVHRMYPWGYEELSDSPGPRAWQSELLGELKEHLSNPETRYTPFKEAVASGHGIGKVISNQVVIDTPIGKRKWEDLRIGDMVWGRNGKSTLITAKFPHTNWNFYKIKFSDGTETFAGLEHKWEVTTRADRDKGNAPKVVTTEEMINNIHRKYQIPLTSAVEYVEQRTITHPYIMGYILGNGSLRTPSAVKVSCYDPELYEYMELLLPGGLKFRGSDEGYMHISANESRDNDGVGGKNLILNEMMDLGLHGKYGVEKFIPDIFKYNSVKNRIHLLRGLMDSDGTISSRIGDNNRRGYKVQFSTSSIKLRDDIIWLVRSLGGVANYSIDDRRDCGYGATNDNYEIHINLPNHINPFYLPRKAGLYDDYVGTVKREPIKTVVSIEYDHTGDGHCITVDADDHLYLANDFIVTHNSAEISLVVHWAMSCFVDCKVVITANTEKQLMTKTMPEMQKWFRMAFNAHWFKVTATRICLNGERENTWRADAIAWSENNTEAFAGLHNEGKCIVVVYDESSTIAEKVWEVTEGALTDKNTVIIWLAFGNPTRNSGRFSECFGRFRHRWKTRHIDSRKVEGTNKEQLGQWVEDYGEDSDFVRIRVKGEFPRAGSMQFISGDMVDAARYREAVAYLDDPLTMGVDVGRFGDDMTVISHKRGNDARSIPWEKLRGADTMAVAARVADLWQQYKHDAVFVDGGGVGGGVVDRLRVLKVPVIEVQFGGSADRSGNTGEGMVIYANKRAEMWGYMRDALKRLAIPNDADLVAELTAVEFGYTMKDGKDAILLEKKADMKKRGLPSPDMGDSLALHWAYPVMPSNHKEQLMPQSATDYSNYHPLSRENARRIGGGNKSHNPRYRNGMGM